MPPRPRPLGRAPRSHCLMNPCMAATYDPDPRAPFGFRIPFNTESGEAIAERWRNWRRHDLMKIIIIAFLIKGIKAALALRSASA